MRTQVVVGAAALLLGVGFLVVAADEPAYKADVMKIAGMVEKDAAGAKKAAADLAKKAEIDEVMALFKLRSRGGLGFGAEPAPASARNTDGVESKLIALGRRPLPAGDIAKQADDIATLANVCAVMAMYTHAKAPTKKVGDKDPKKWTAWCDDMEKASMELAAAAKAKDAKAIKDAAANVNAACNECHSVFRD